MPNELDEQRKQKHLNASNERVELAAAASHINCQILKLGKTVIASTVHMTTYNI